MTAAATMTPTTRVAIDSCVNRLRQRSTVDAGSYVWSDALRGACRAASVSECVLIAWSVSYGAGPVGLHAAAESNRRGRPSLELRLPRFARVFELALRGNPVLQADHLGGLHVKQIMLALGRGFIALEEGV